jgi:hypothetical protein
MAKEKREKVGSLGQEISRKLEAGLAKMEIARPDLALPPVPASKPKASEAQKKPK